MARLFYILPEAAAAAVVLLPVFILLNLFVLHDWRRSALYCVFTLYLAAVYVLVGMPNVTYIRFELNLSLVPVLGMLEDVKNSILNVALFIPLGVMLPVLWEQYAPWKKAARFGFGLSLVIELLQIFTYRLTDINDLITNTLGTLLGWWAARALLRTFPRAQAMGKDAYVTDLYLLCAITLLVMFFVQPFVYSVLWDFLLH